MEQIVLYKANGDQVLLQSLDPVISIKKAEQKKQLLGVNTVTIEIESSEPVVINIKDSVLVFGERYTCNALPNPEKISKNKFRLNTILESVQYDLLNAIYFDTDVSGFNTSPDFSLTGTIQDFMEVLINNANRVFPGKWSLGSCITTNEKTISFNEEKCLAVLQKVCKEFNTEFEIIEDGLGGKTINVGPVGIILGHTFEYGQGEGLYKLSRTSLTDKSLFNRLYLFGGTKNIPAGYRNNSLRLRIEGDYIEDAGSIAAFGLIEKTRTFEEIFPKRTGTVSSLGSSELIFSDASIDFDVNANLVSGVSPKVSFNAGGLAGLSFEVSKYNHSTKTFTLIPYKDDRGFVFPNPTETAFQIGIGDTYVLTDINLPSSYITNAEAELLAEGQIELNQNIAPRVQYGLDIYENYLKNVAGSGSVVNFFMPGDYITVLDADIQVNGSTRITGITRDCLYPYRYLLEVGDSVQISIIERVFSDLKAAKQIIKFNKLYDAIKARMGWKTTQELLNMVFDTDGYFETGNIRPLSIETSMLVVAAKSQQFVLQVVIEPNYQGNKNVVKVSNGKLVHYAIFETNVTWQITGSTYSITDDNARYIYAKCSKTDHEDAILVFSTAQIRIDEDANYFHFLVGILHTVDNGVRWISLTYGASAINGRFIKTGRVQSFDGKTFIDLDTAEMAGKISFINADGEYVAMEEFNQYVVDFIDTTYPQDKEITQNQIDGKIEAWFQDANPNVWDEAERAKHDGDMWYHLTDKKLYRYKALTNTWERIQDADAIAAYEAASQAQDTADGKRRVFLETPYPPYDEGDLWTDGTDLKRCITAKPAGESYNALDWNLATAYDNTKTVIDSGVVTSGRIQLAGDDTNIKAGITGQGTADSSVRFWAGTSYENRAIAPFRVLQDGSTYFREKLVLTNDTNQEEAGISGSEGTGATNVRFWAGNTFANRGVAPFRVLHDGTMIATKGIFGFLEIAGQSLKNDFESDGYIVLRNDDKQQFSAIGTDVAAPSSGGIRISAKHEQKGNNPYNTNYGLIARASNSGIRNVAILADEGESLFHQATINGRTTYKQTISSPINQTIDVSLVDLVEITPTVVPCGCNFVGTVYDGKEVTMVNPNDSTPYYLYSTARAGTVTIEGGEVVTMVYSSGFWYLKCRYDNDF